MAAMTWMWLQWASQLCAQSYPWHVCILPSSPDTNYALRNISYGLLWMQIFSSVCQIPPKELNFMGVVCLQFVTLLVAYGTRESASFNLGEPFVLQSWHL